MIGTQDIVIVYTLPTGAAIRLRRHVYDHMNLRYSTPHRSEIGQVGHAHLIVRDLTDVRLFSPLRRLGAPDHAVGVVDLRLRRESAVNQVADQPIRARDQYAESARLLCHTSLYSGPNG